MVHAFVLIQRFLCAASQVYFTTNISFYFNDGTVKIVLDIAAKLQNQPSEDVSRYNISFSVIVTSNVH